MEWDEKKRREQGTWRVCSITSGRERREGCGEEGEIELDRKRKKKNRKVRKQMVLRMKEREQKECNRKCCIKS